MHAEALAELAARASTLDERITGVVELHPDDPAAVNTRLARWSEKVAGGDAERFEERLALDGLDGDSVRLVAGGCSWPAGEPLPEWTSLIAEGLEELAAEDLDGDDCLLRDDRGPIPLQELALPFVRAARRRLAPRLDPHRGLLAPAVPREFERRLLAELGAVAARVGELEFRCWRRPLIAPLDEAIERAGGQPGSGLYRKWIAELRGGGLADVMRAYPVLARQIGVLALAWVETTTEFAERLARDLRVLADTFSGAAPLGRLETLGDARSDPHRGQRRVIECRFASGVTLIYKPKPLATEVAYSRLVEWLNERGTNPALRVLRVVDRGDYGWVEYAAHEPVADPAGAGRFYSRAGSLLALMHAIGGKDCHFENLIAAGEHPIVIDAETVLHPLFKPVDAGADGERRAAADRMQRSVLAVGMLPSWIVAADGHAYDIGALGAIGAQVMDDSLPDWEHPNTDVARLVLRSRTVGPARNELQIAGVAQRPQDYAEHLRAGFERAYRLLCGRGDDLLADDGPLAGLRAAPVRALFRPTHVYVKVLSSAGAPSRLSSGVDYGIELEILGRPLLDAPAPSELWELHRSEQRQLNDRDVPYLSTPGSAEWLLSAGGNPILSFEASALEAARRQLESLGEADMRYQASLIEAALGADPSEAPPYLAL
ncbi:MAG TPA: type 2 lanthipeptide synthetase LanM family protein [Solirubrobacteraceae bacterium]